LPIPKFWSSNDVEFILGVGHKVSIAKISSINVQAIKLPKKPAKSQGSEGNNSRINAVLGRCSHMATSNKRRLATQVMLDIKDEVNTDALLITRRFCTSPHIVKGAISINLVHFVGQTGELK
jgi:hypothetical protein